MYSNIAMAQCIDVLDKHIEENALQYCADSLQLQLLGVLPRNTIFDKAREILWAVPDFQQYPIIQNQLSKYVYQEYIRLIEKEKHDDSEI